MWSFLSMFFLFELVAQFTPTHRYGCHQPMSCMLSRPVACQDSKEILPWEAWISSRWIFGNFPWMMLVAGFFLVVCSFWVCRYIFTTSLGKETTWCSELGPKNTMSYFYCRSYLGSIHLNRQLASLKHGDPETQWPPELQFSRESPSTFTSHCWVSIPEYYIDLSLLWFVLDCRFKQALTKLETTSLYI